MSKFEIGTKVEFRREVGLFKKGARAIVRKLADDGLVVAKCGRYQTEARVRTDDVKVAVGRKGAKQS